ncbi:MAG: hypothetical protein HY791_30865 [Deltaproteobacteria bacterium]|nr:hypothetical protein [Deltaproteobacteria bacterium]
MTDTNLTELATEEGELDPSELEGVTGGVAVNVELGGTSLEKRTEVKDAHDRYAN